LVAVFFGLSKPQTGGQNRFSHIVQQLRKHGNDVIVLEPHNCFDIKDLELAKVYTYPKYTLFQRGLSLLKDVDIWFITALVQILRNEKVDIISIEYPSSALAIYLAAKITNTSAPIIYSSHNFESKFAHEVMSQVAEFSEFERKIIPPYISLLERVTAKHLATHITAVSDADKALFCSRYGLAKAKVTVIPNGCQLRDPLSKQARERVRAEMGFAPDSVVVAFHGSFIHPANKDALDCIANSLAPALAPDRSIVFALYGSGFPKFKRANVKSFGFVEDVHQALFATDIALAPLRSGGGTKLKIFDYMNAALPTITTPKGIEGIHATDKEHVIIVDTTDQIIEAIRDLVKNESERRRIGLNAHRLVEREYNWERIGPRLDQLYREIKDTHDRALSLNNKVT
jgi:glycosyltransferase involved in cell wall biosynthesis